MKIILIGNYELDKQESMLRFAALLADGLKEKGVESEIWNPVAFFGNVFGATNSGIAKWFGYIDKWILFPIILKWRLLLHKKLKSNEVRFHICDHSNAPYLPYLPKDRTAITCHDVLAIRGAMGYKDAYCPASGSGKILQNWIFKNLIKARLLAAVSHFSLEQLNDLSQNLDTNKVNWTVIHNAFNAKFFPMKDIESHPLLEKIGIKKDIPYLLHVGGGHLRKNRTLLVKLIAFLGDKWDGIICFAGKPIDNTLKDLIDTHGLNERVISIIRPDHKELVALYSSCEAFVFPSYAEGFGWPVIEAQACGVPVIASSLDPMPEVSGGAAFHAHPDDVEGFAKALMMLKSEIKRKEVVTKGFKNIERFHVSKMIEDYISLHANGMN